MSTTTTADPLATGAFELPENVGLTAPPPALPQAPALNPRPGWREVLREQFAAVGLQLRREGIFAACCALFGTAMILWAETAKGPVNFPLSPKEGAAAMLMALFIPTGVWKDEEPARRGYHRAMPVDHAAHAAARSAAGLGWTLAAVAAFFGWLGFLSLVTAGEVEQVAAWQWLAPFVAATAAYLFGSALTLVSRRPWRWLGGGLVAYVFLNALRGVDALQPLIDLANTLMTGRYGLVTLLTGEPLPFNHADLLTWLSSAWIWLTASAGAFLLAARRQPEG